MDIKNVTTKAALALSDNDFDVALRLLKQTLRMSRTNLALAGDDEEQGAGITAGGMVCVPALSDDGLSLLEASWVNNDFLLFDRIFVPSSQDSPARQSMACLYNLGLCYHLGAFRNPSADYRTMLNKATFFYRMGIDTTQQLVHEEENPDPFVVIMHLAFLNNNGHISSHLLDEEDSRWHSETILTTVLTYLRGRGVADPFSTGLEAIIPGGPRPVSALSFFCPLRFYMQLGIPAPAA